MAKRELIATRSDERYVGVMQTDGSRNHMMWQVTCRRPSDQG